MKRASARTIPTRQEALTTWPRCSATLTDWLRPSRLFGECCESSLSLATARGTSIRTSAQPSITTPGGWNSCHFFPYWKKKPERLGFPAPSVTRCIALRLSSFNEYNYIHAPRSITLRAIFRCLPVPLELTCLLGEARLGS